MDGRTEKEILELACGLGLDVRVLLVSLGCSVLCALFCGLAPALQSTRLDLVKGASDGRIELMDAARVLRTVNGL